MIRLTGNKPLPILPNQKHVFVESMIKKNAIGVEMTRKVKRIGCSNIKDLVERDKIDIVDADTIIEFSTFVAKGNSYEASDGNHDDLVMNFVLFGWFASSSLFNDMTDVNIKELMYQEKMKQVEDELVPFGMVDDGRPEESEIIDGERRLFQSHINMVIGQTDIQGKI